MSGATAATYFAIAAAAGSAISAYGQLEEGKAQRRAANADALAKEEQARDAVNRGNIEQEKQRQKTQQVMGAQRAAMGASGAQADSGSFGNVLLDTATTGEQDAQTIRTNALRSAWGLETEADITRWKGKQAEKASKYKAAGTILTGAASAYGIAK